MHDEGINPIKDPKLDRGEVEAAAAAMASLDEIAAYFDCDIDVIEEHYAAVVRKGWAKGKLRIRQWWMEAAEKGDDEARKFLAIQHLSEDGGRR